MLRKITVGGMALGVLAALALPATAGASWKHNGVPIQQDVQFNLEGTALVQSALGGTHCKINSRVKLTAGTTTGHIETWDRVGGDTAACQGTGGLAFCEIHNVNPTNLSWPIHTAGTTTTQIQITKGEIHSTTTGAFCPMETLTYTPATVTATVDAHRFSSVTLSGNIQVDAQTTGPGSHRSPHTFNGTTDKLAAQMGGTLQIVNPTQRATYEI